MEAEHLLNLSAQTAPALYISENWNLKNFPGKHAPELP